MNAWSHDIFEKLPLFIDFRPSKWSRYVNWKCGGISDDAHSRRQIVGDFAVLQKVGILIVFCITSVLYVGFGVMKMHDIIGDLFIFNEY